MSLLIIKKYHYYYFNNILLLKRHDTLIFIKININIHKNKY